MVLLILSRCVAGCVQCVVLQCCERVLLTLVLCIADPEFNVSAGYVDVCVCVCVVGVLLDLYSIAKPSYVLRFSF